MILETPRLILRPFREEDIGRFAELMADPDFTRFSPGPYTYEQTQGVLQKFLSWNQADLPSQFAVIFRANNYLVGYCGFLHHKVDGKDEIEIGYRLHPDNVPSRRVAEKNGMKIERDTVFRGFPTQVFAITREAWLAKRDAE